MTSLVLDLRDTDRIFWVRDCSIDPARRLMLTLLQEYCSCKRNNGGQALGAWNGGRGGVDEKPRPRS